MSETNSPRSGIDARVRTMPGAPGELMALAHLLQRTAAALVALTQDPVPDGQSPSVTDRLSRLTPAERRIAGLVRQGHTNEQVARRIRVSPHTVNYHLRQVYRKLGISSRVQLAGLPWPYTVV